VNLRSYLRPYFALVVEKLWFFLDVARGLLFLKQEEKCIQVSDYFLTGNYFKNLADIVVQNEPFVNVGAPIDFLGQSKLKAYFVDISKVDPLNFRKNLTKIDFGSKIIFHNGDKLDTFNLEKLDKDKFRIFAVNSVNQTGVTALPIGLENRDLNRNGITEDFYQVENLLEKSQLERRIPICVNFRLRTNFDQRMNTLRDVSAHPDAKFFWLKSPKSMHSVYKKSMFVISPPGNGHDCHRTWEALYCGAIPIVLSNEIDTELIKNLPILAVNNYSDLRNYSLASLRLTYRQMWDKSDLSKLSPGYWRDQIYKK
jgi:hypothetical protein